jgi:uncharacterized tellurite resistance protein B-like protein
MNILYNFDHPEKKRNKEYFIQLVRSAKADDIIHNSELQLLNRVGRKLGLTDPEIELLIEETGKSDFTPPFELGKRFEQVYEIAGIILADGKIDENEMRMIKGFAIKSGFSDDEIPAMLQILFNGKKDGKDAEELFEEYKRKKV